MCRVGQFSLSLGLLVLNFLLSLMLCSINKGERSYPRAML